MIFPDSELRLVVFDFDGVISDSEPAHFEAIRNTLKSIGIDLTWEQYCSTYLTYTDREAFQKVLQDRKREPTQDIINELVEKKRIEFAHFLDSNLKIMPGAPELLADLNKYQIPCGICSGSIRSEIEFVLRQTDLFQFFRFIVASEDVSRNKPDPQPYLLSMQLGREFVNGDRELSPLECVVVEDSFGGIQAAKAAGMLCLAVTNSYPADKLQQADKVVDELTEVNADFFRQLIKNA